MTPTKVTPIFEAAYAGEQLTKTLPFKDWSDGTRTGDPESRFVRLSLTYR